MHTRLTYRWELLAWLWLAFFLNQADRQVFSVVLPLMRADLGLTDIQAGLIASIFTGALGIMVPLAGYAGDVFSRKWIVTVSLVVWSAATMLTGFAAGMVWLIVVRSLATALGEAFYAPSATALISEHHVETRAQAMAVHQTALYTGVVVSGWAAGYIGQHFGWRASFWLFGVLGVALGALLAWRLKDSGAARRIAGRAPPLLVLKTITRRPTVLLLAMAFAGMVFVNVGFLTWMPTYLHERFELSLASAGFASMFYHHLGAFAGVVLGGRLSDRLAPRRPAVRPAMQAAALFLGAPFLYLLGSSGTLMTVQVALACFGLFRGIYDANIYAALYEVIESRFHASAAAVIIAFAFTAGAFAPVALGAAKQTVGLSGGLSWLSAVYLVSSALALLATCFFFSRDRAAVTAGDVYQNAGYDRKEK